MDTSHPSESQVIAETPPSTQAKPSAWTTPLGQQAEQFQYEPASESPSQPTNTQSSDTLRPDHSYTAADRLRFQQENDAQFEYYRKHGKWDTEFMDSD